MKIEDKSIVRFFG